MTEKIVEIKYGDLFVTGYIGEESVNFPIKKIPEMEEAAYEHIHGHLTIKIGDEKLLHLGFYGDDDVCFNEWIPELSEIVKNFSKSSKCRYLYCSGEQGDPAFEFCREEDAVYISYIDTEFYYSLHPHFFDISQTQRTGKGDYVCNYKDFDLAVGTFLEQVKTEIFLELGDFAPTWWKNIFGE